MVSKSKNAGQAKGEAEMWINPNSTFKASRAGEGPTGGGSSSSRYLDLADIALGLKKLEGKKKKSARNRPEKNRP
jgi:hypothetical protein